MVLRIGPNKSIWPKSYSKKKSKILSIRLESNLLLLYKYKEKKRQYHVF